jgi:hypothetical protein
MVDILQVVSLICLAILVWNIEGEVARINKKLEKESEKEKG